MSKLEALLKYHEAAQELDQLESTVKSSDAYKRLARLRGFLSEQQSQVTAIQKQFDSRKALVDKLTAQFGELQKQYDLEISEFEIMEKDEECTAAEMTESRKNIEALINRLAASRKELFDTLAYIEKATAEYKETYTKAGKAKKEFDAVKAECEKESGDAAPRLAELKAKIKGLEKDVDPALLKKYQNIRSRCAVPMAKVANDQCGGCNMALPTSVVKRVAAGTGIVECENCGRILYQ